MIHSQGTALWQPHSSVGWVDVDRDEAKRVRELLGMFRAPEAIDPHGILPLQLVLSDRLFPGMSTQHTRARYVMFVAWHAQRLADGTIGAGKYKRLRDDEVALMWGLLANDDTTGVFGKRKRDATQTLPSSVYWTALQRWEILAYDQSAGSMQQAVAAVRVRRSTVQLSDDAANYISSRTTQVLPTDFPDLPTDFPENQSLTMRRCEADYLTDKIAASCPESFLRIAFADHALAERRYPWPDDGNIDLDSVWGKNLRDAQCFSELIHPARLLYSTLLAEMAHAQGVDVPHVVEQTKADFELWREETHSRIPLLRRWVASDLDRLLLDVNISLRRSRRDFIRTAVSIAADRPDTCLYDNALADEVRQIERTVKRTNARLQGGEPFRRWLRQPTRLASQRLDYRWGSVTQFLDDMSAAV